MNLHFISVIPIEFYTPKNMEAVEQRLLDDKLLMPEDEISLAFSELTSKKGRFYKLVPSFDSESEFSFAIHESSACVYIHSIDKDYSINRETVLETLKNRSAFHKKLLKPTNSPERKLLSKICNTGQNAYILPKINYVFSFYIFEQSEDTISQEEIRILVEPSLVDADDMLSSSPCSDVGISWNIKKEYADKLIDVDIASNVATYISWASVVSIAEKQAFNKTKILISVLECRLQIVWNRCYSLSQYIDDIFTQKEKLDDIKELYWSFVQNLDDAKSVLTATYSSRANALFLEMVKTSRITDEINRLDKKITLLEKYIDQQNTLRSRKYQKTIEFLLFITAVSALVQIFLPLPLSILPTFAEYALIAMVFSLGVYAIIKNK